MTAIKSSLIDLGFTEEEAKIYLTCLEFGSQSVSNIANFTKIGRINCYHYIEKLKSRGFLIQEKKKNVKYFYAENPNILINKQKERINIAQQIMPEMLAMASSSPQKPKIQFFEGLDGIKKIFEKMLEIPKTEIVSFSNFETLNNIPDAFLIKHFKKRDELKIKTRFISPLSKKSDKFREIYLEELAEKKLLEVFFISPDEFYFASEISIFSGNIAIFSLSNNNLQGVLIENPEIFQTQKAIFDLAWLGATSFVVR